MSVQNSNYRITKQIFKCFKDYNKKKINVNQLIDNLSGNINALESVSTSIIDDFQCFAGEIEFIFFTENKEDIEFLQTKIVNKYKKIFKKYLLDR